MKYPTVRLVYDRRKIASVSRPALIDVEIYYAGKRKWITTGVKVFPSQWDPQKNVINHTDRVNLNLRIENVRKPIENYITTLMLQGLEFSFDGLQQSLLRDKNNGRFDEFVRERIESREDIKMITRRSHRRLIGALELYGRIRTFDDLTAARIRDFDSWLHQKYQKQSTVAVYHKLLKNYIHIAISEDLVKNDPYTGMRIDKGKPSARRYLTDSELQQVRNFETEDRSVMRARDLFLFQCFTGLAYADLARFDFKSAIERNGRYIVRDIRQKSEEEYYIVLIPPALEILRKYEFKLPIISNQKYNSALKAVAAGAGIRYRVTSHMGRHTFATYCLNNGIRIETLAAMMGHRDIKSTQIYARMVNKSVEQAFESLEDSLEVREKMCNNVQ